MFITSRTQTQVNTMKFKECPSWVTDRYENDMTLIDSAKSTLDWVDMTWDDDGLTLLYLLTAQCRLMAAMSALNEIDPGFYEEVGFYPEIESECEYYRNEVLDAFASVKEAIKGALSVRRQLVQA